MESVTSIDLFLCNKSCKTVQTNFCRTMPLQRRSNVLVDTSQIVFFFQEVQKVFCVGEEPYLFL